MNNKGGYVGNGPSGTSVPPSYPSDNKAPREGYGFTAPNQSYGASSANPDNQPSYNNRDKMGQGYGHSQGQRQHQSYGQQHGQGYGQRYNGVGNQGQATGHTGSGQPIYVVNQPQPQRDPFFIPPAAVFFKRGCGFQFWINILLLILAFIPAIIHAFYIIAVTPTVSKPPRR